MYHISGTLFFISILEAVLRKKSLVVCVFGPQGAGKEGISLAIRDAFNLVRVSMSQAIREKSKADAEYVARFPFRVGVNYPFEAAELAFKAFVDRYANNVGFVVDGVPRDTPEQVEMVIDRFSPIDYDVLFLHVSCSRNTCENRVRGRREAMLNAGQPERSDDKPEILKGRLDAHFAEVDILIDAIRAFGGNLIEVDAEKPQDEVIRESIERIAAATSVSVAHA